MTLNCYVDGKSDYSNRECARKDGHNPRKLQSIHYSLMGKSPNLVWRTVRSVPCLPLLALLYASCCGSLKGQTRPSEIRFQGGTATFFEAPQHVTLGGAYRKYFGRTGWGIEPEFSWMTEGKHMDNILAINLVKDFSKPTARRIWYMVMGGGVIRKTRVVRWEFRRLVGALE